MKSNPRVKSVQAKANYSLRLTFSNGEKRDYDVRPLVDQGGVFSELKHKTAFLSAHPWHGTVQWAGGQDICPDTLYEDSVPVKATAPAVRETPAKHKDYRYPKAKQGRNILAR